MLGVLEQHSSEVSVAEQGGESGRRQGQSHSKEMEGKGRKERRKAGEGRRKGRRKQDHHQVLNTFKLVTDGWFF